MRTGISNILVIMPYVNFLGLGEESLEGRHLVLFVVGIKLLSTKFW
jgi:hypothetical protein